MALPETVPALPPDRTELMVTTVFCDEAVRKLSFRRRKLGLRFYAMRLAQALTGVGVPVDDEQDEKLDQHVVLVTAIERDPTTKRIIRTINSGGVTCPHME